MTTSDCPRRPRQVFWPHTGIHAPDRLAVTDHVPFETSRDVGYSAVLVHPTLGPVGRIHNDGRGAATGFQPADAARFGQQDLAAFVTQCAQDGHPMNASTDGVGTFLDQVVAEAAYADAAAQMRAHDLFLIRFFLPRAHDTTWAWRGPALSCGPVRLSPTQRRELIDQLPDHPAATKPAGAHWEMFNGRRWTALSLQHPFTAVQQADRVRAVAALTAASGGIELFDAGPLPDGFYVSELEGVDEYVLVEDSFARACDVRRWCHCADRTLAAVRVQRWSPSAGVLDSVLIHRDPACRRLLVIT
jgi:hypothetical protein